MNLLTICITLFQADKINFAFNVNFLSQDGRIDYSEFVAMMQDTSFGKKGFQNTASIQKKNALKS